MAYKAELIKENHYILRLLDNNIGDIALGAKVQNIKVLIDLRA
jgi:hypothetical protein